VGSLAALKDDGKCLSEAREAYFAMHSWTSSSKLRPGSMLTLGRTIVSISRVDAAV
jgi:hypothetical protein